MEIFLNENNEFEDRETVLDLYFKIRDFFMSVTGWMKIIRYTAACCQMVPLW